MMLKIQKSTNGDVVVFTLKTHSVEAAAEVLLGDPHAIIKIDCGEFQHSHEISKLVGSPPLAGLHREEKKRMLSYFTGYPDRQRRRPDIWGKKT